jgi:hypothetical protein
VASSRNRLSPEERRSQLLDLGVRLRGVRVVTVTGPTLLTIVQ